MNCRPCLVIALLLLSPLAGAVNTERLEESWQQDQAMRSELQQIRAELLGDAPSETEQEIAQLLEEESLSPAPTEDQTAEIAELLQEAPASSEISPQEMTHIEHELERLQ